MPMCVYMLCEDLYGGVYVYALWIAGRSTGRGEKVQADGVGTGAKTENR